MPSWLPSFMRRGGDNESVTTSTSTSSTTTTTSTTTSAPTTTDDTHAHADAHGDCSSCADPCHPYTSYPATFWSSISQSDMSNSVKSHKRHIVVAQGGSYETWPSEVTSSRHSYMHHIDDVVSRHSSRIGYRVRLSACDTPMQTPVSDDDERELFADLYVFPDMIMFPSVPRDRLDAWVTQVLVEDRGRVPLRSGSGGARQLIEDETYRRASSSATGAVARHNWLGLDFPHEELLGTYFLLCAHKLRDKRCSISAPILANEIAIQHRERVSRYEQAVGDSEAAAATSATTASTPSRPLVRPSPVECLYISHVGGHKFAGNLIAYPGGVWLGRVRPADVHTILDAFTEVRDATAQQRLVALQRGHLDW